MADIRDVWRLASALPGTEEGTHLRRPALRVGDRSFIGTERDGRLAFRLEPERVAEVAAELGADEIRRFDKPIGVRVDPATLDEPRLATLVELSWRSVAPKRLIRARQSDQPEASA